MKGLSRPIGNMMTRIIVIRRGVQKAIQDSAHKFPIRNMRAQLQTRRVLLHGSLGTNKDQYMTNQKRKKEKKRRIVDVI